MSIGSLVIYGLLLQYFAVLASKKPLNFKLLNLLVKPLMEMSMEIPYFAAICACQQISWTRTQFCDDIKNQDKRCWPSLKTIFLFRLWSKIFPCSDFRHVVMTPATLLMCEYLSIAQFFLVGMLPWALSCSMVLSIGYITGAHPVWSFRLLAYALHLKHHIAVTKESQKFCPEAILFLQTLLMAALKRNPTSSKESQVYSLLELKALGPLLCIGDRVDEISPLDFIMLVDLPEDSSFFSYDNFSFVKGRDHDPDCGRVERRKLNKLLKREAKGAARELWKDNHFLYEAKQREKAMLDEEKAEMYGKAKAFLQEQEHAFKSGQWGKGRKRRR
ncbi:Nucleolar protein 14 [Dillenia turbinata]|uniref:Nucleolar protein 14 n=1 Tax=Dillenia turbinata TaxID=194707 RepID=A0AAN8VGQ6_9MAGN